MYCHDLIFALRVKITLHLFFKDEFIEEDFPKDKPTQLKKAVSSTASKTSEITAKIQPRVRTRSPLRSTESSSRISSMVSRISRTKSPPQHIAAVSPTKIEKSRSTSRRTVDRPSTRRPTQDRVWGILRLLHNELLCQPLKKE